MFLRNFKLLIFLFLCSFLFSCSETKPSGHAYTVNGLGLTLPTPDLEMAFLPYPSRADFFHEPISEAYKFATLGLDEALAPLCDEALALVSEEELSIDKARESLLEEGNVPETPDACMNMCLSRVDLEDQREADRTTLNKKIAEIDVKIRSANQKRSELQSARSKKAGALSQQLSSLKEKRNQLISREAEALAAEQISKLSIDLGNGNFRRSFYPSSERLEYITVMFRNNSDYALAKSEWGGDLAIRAEGYYKGVKIKDYFLDLPAYDFDDNFTDSLGFDKGYFLNVGGIIPIGPSIYRSVQGLDMNSPSGRLLAQERNWKPNSRGYILPDEMRIATFPKSAFVIPDEKGKRDGNEIVYTPTTVNFKDEVATRGLPQDSEIAKISKQISDQSFPEDSQIASLDNEIAGFRAEQKSLRSAFNSSDTAKNITSLDRSESLCRAASVAMNEIDDRNKVINKWKTNLSSCGTEAIDSGAIFSAIDSINYDQGGSIIELPDIDQKYAAKAGQLIFKKLASEAQGLTRTDINGAFTIDGSVDQKNSMLFAPTVSIAGERFWMQPLSSMGDNKNLNHSLISDQDFLDYVNNVIDYSCRDCSIQEFTNLMETLGLSAPNSNQLVKSLSQSEMLYASELEMISSDESIVLGQDSPERETVAGGSDQTCQM